ncbi:3488_t:CDS:2 [Ambispora gerdemannii]|uniref:3488_t:CDS:1 n=1 Tax=Ambispora gerdemannii TaxID=144530 RepID=A0A9N8YQD9_9GLOM|nr:3488_t:CDS:2 [Ambispora gerdemannii]
MHLPKNDFSTTPLQFTLLITFIDFPVFTAYFLMLTIIILDQILLLNLSRRRARRENAPDSETPLLSVSSTTSLISFNLIPSGHSSYFIALAGFLSLCAPLLSLFEIYDLPWAIGRMLGWFGLFLIVLGYLFRVYSINDKWSTRTVVVENGLVVIGNGPYRYIRHPGYTGQIIAWIGFALSSGDLSVIIIILSMTLLAYWHRIRVEEETMVEKFGDEYREYQRSTKKLIPFIY